MQRAARDVLEEGQAVGRSGIEGEADRGIRICWRERSRAPKDSEDRRDAMKTELCCLLRKVIEFVLSDLSVCHENPKLTGTQSFLINRISVDARRTCSSTNT